MPDNFSTPATTASTPQAEMDALLAMVGSLSQMSLDLTRVCVEVQNVVPGIALSKQALQLTSLCLDVKDQIRHTFTVVAEAAVAAATAPVPPPAPLVEWVRGIALTPNQLEAAHPQGICDDLAWQVVCVGREPGMFVSADEASANISGVPNGYRKKKDTRLEALAFYRARYADNKIEKLREAPVAADSDPAATDSDSAPAATVASALAAADDSAPATTDSVVQIDSDSDADPADEELGWVAGDVSLVKIKSAIAE
ncbi:hypothetical protein C8R43DRAFT_1121728 [Mycena crocata]|nr:hypothetical protein C8R43DRAFT_1121728 [Mycena crocata]